ncbi:hypothetical protein PIB30_099279, partial [Stylosanthes scabra]|nr:hypothetical protein [Stylosanthes scabra]
RAPKSLFGEALLAHTHLSHEPPTFRLDTTGYAGSPKPLEVEPGLSRKAPNAADSAQLHPENLKAGPKLEADSCTNVFDDKIVALQKNKTLLETDDGKSPGLGIRFDSNPGPLFVTGLAS